VGEGSWWRPEEKAPREGHQEKVPVKAGKRRLLEETGGRRLPAKARPEKAPGGG
jgi:hypothetical protein